jgi:hypothetical protein
LYYDAEATLANHASAAVLRVPSIALYKQTLNHMQLPCCIVVLYGLVENIDESAVTTIAKCLFPPLVCIRVAAFIPT